MALPEMAQGQSSNILAGTLGESVAILLAAGNTDDLIAWDRLPARLKKMPPALSDSERVDLLLALASGDHLSMLQFSQLSGGGVSEDLETRERLRLTGESPTAATMCGKASPNWLKAPAAAGHRKGIRDALDCLLDPTNTKQKKDELTKLIALNASRDNMICPSWSKDGRVDRIISRNIAGGLLYALWLVADESRPFRKRLCRCRFSRCERYFLKRRPGRGAGAPIRMYCTAEHGVEGDREKARKRMKKRQLQKLA